MLLRLGHLKNFLTELEDPLDFSPMDKFPTSLLPFFTTYKKFIHSQRRTVTLFCAALDPPGIGYTVLIMNRACEVIPLLIKRYCYTRV